MVQEVTKSGTIWTVNTKKKHGQLILWNVFLSLLIVSITGITFVSHSLAYFMGHHTMGSNLKMGI